MPYPIIPSRRMPYDIDGTEIAYNITNAYENGIAIWLDSAQKGKLNSEVFSSVYKAEPGSDGISIMWVFFPEIREVEQILITMKDFNNGAGSLVLQGSVDSTDGVNGTWETAVLPNGSPVVNNFITNWRTGVKPVQFSGPKKILRMKISGYYECTMGNIHIFGRKAAGEYPNDIIILDDIPEGDPEFTTLKDWGDRPEGTTEISRVLLRNMSPDKTANGINIQLNHADFTISWNSDGPWSSTLDIPILSPGSISAPIYIKNELAPPLLILGPKTSRLVIGVTSWT